MELKFFCPRWGSEHIGWNDFMAKTKTAGYDGIELGIPQNMTVKELDLVWEEAEKQGVLLLIQHYDTCAAEFNRHYDKYANWFEKIRPYPTVKINTQAGRDFFSYQQNKALIDLATDFSAVSRTAVFHETHRSKFSFAAHITQEYLRRIPELRLTLDVSHWVCVAEAFLEDQQEALELAIARTGHLHARVGHPEGPQIPDPRVPEWRDALDVHLNWWDQVVSMWKANNEYLMTVTPEFGPAPYMIHLPNTRQPISDQWAVNVYIMELLKARYSNSN